MTDGAEIPFAGLIAGGTKGIGLAIAARLARPGATLFLSYSGDEAAAGEAVALIKRKGAKAIAIKADAGSEEGARATIARVAAEVKHLDALVHSAAVANPGPLMSQDMGEIRRAIEVGGMALLYLVRAAADLLAGGGTVLFLSGASTSLVLPNHGALASAKALGECFVKYLAIECAPRGINLNTLGAGPIDTALSRVVRGGAPGGVPKTPNGRELAPEDVAEVAAFLVSGAASMVRGQSVLVDGALSLTPRSR